MNKVFIIAEAGVNHNGDVSIAKKMIEVAAKAGADVVKFQTFQADKVVSINAEKAGYQKKTTGSNESQYQMIKKLEIDKEGHIALIDHCKKNNIQFLSTPFDLDSIDLLVELGMGLFKIPSGEITNLPYLRKIGVLNKKIILSTGMSDLGDIENAVDVLIKSGTEREKISLLHCNTEYPTLFEDVNLNAMITIKNAFKMNVGYSDHTEGIEVPIAAVAMGATIIEKHFTLDKAMEGPDHKASLEPNELENMIKAIRNIEKSMGSGLKKPSLSESKNISIVRKSIVALRDIKIEEVFSEENITVKRPGNGISPMEWDKIIGKKATREFKKDELIKI